jgi:hypothetical protein
MPNPQTYYKFSFKGTEKLYLFFSDSKSKKAALVSWLFWHFQIPLQNWYMWIHQTCKKFFSRGYEEVSLQFIVILNPRWPHWPLFCLDIFSLLWRTTASKFTKFTRNVHLRVLKKCWYVLYRVKIQDGHTSLWTTACLVIRMARNVPLGECHSYLIRNPRWLSLQDIVST